MACRNTERADTARRRLLGLLDAEVVRLKKSSGYDGHAESFRHGLRIDCLSLNLASIDSVFDFAEETTRRYAICIHFYFFTIP